MSIHDVLIADVLARCLPDVVFVSADMERLVLTISTKASGKEIFDAEAQLRKETGVMYELMCGRLPDANKLRVRLAKFRGIGDAT